MSSLIKESLVVVQTQDVQCWLASVLRSGLVVSLLIQQISNLRVLEYLTLEHRWDFHCNSSYILECATVQNTFPHEELFLELQKYL